MEDNNNNNKICQNTSEDTTNNFNPLTSITDTKKNLQLVYSKDKSKEITTKIKEEEEETSQQKNQKEEIKFKLYQKVLGELFGTIILVYECCGSPTFNSDKLYVGVIASACSVSVIIYCFVKISGAHFNPAVSLAFYMNGSLGLKEFLLYMLAQFVGAFIGCCFIALSRKGRFDELAGTKIQDYLIHVHGGTEIDAWCYISCLFAETFSTFILIIFSYAISEKYNQLGINLGLCFALALMALIFTAANISGSSFNPARSLAPAALQALAGGDTKPIEQIWIYFVGPFAGAIIAFYAWKIFTVN